MNTTRPWPLLLVLPTALLLAACGGVAPIVGEPTLAPVTPATATPGGVVAMWLPTEPPTPVIPAVPPPTLAAPQGGVPAAPGGPVQCPAPGNPIPPDVPPSYAQYATTINRFLSDGGAIPFLNSILRTWGAADEDFGLVTDAYDLTGDGVFEVLVIVTDPLNATLSPLPGQLMAFGCDQNDYRLLYTSDYGPGVGIPRLLYVGDMNADVQPELVFFQERCEGPSCVQAAQILSWSAPHDGFLALNVDVIGATGGQFFIQDLDDDGILEIMIQGGGAPTDISAGPPRGATTVWDWNGLNYVRALSQLDAPLYRIHVIHDADLALERGDGQEAARLYHEALENPRLGTWHVPNESQMLRAYALYRLLLTYAYLEDDAALDIYSTLIGENPQGAPAYGYAVLAEAFWGLFQSTHNLHTACVSAVEAMPLHPETLLFLNSYGPSNRTYAALDLCPF